MKNGTKLFTLKIGGEAGQGQQVAGLIFAKACSRGGLYTYDYSEYPSLIRGGLVTYQISVSEEPVFAAYNTVNLLVCLSKAAFINSKKELSDNAAVFYDGDKFKIEPGELPKIRQINLFSLPLTTIIRQAGLLPITANQVTLGAVAAVLDFDRKLLHSMIKDIFGAKGEKVVEMNIKAIEAGFDYAKNNCRIKNYTKLNTKPEKKDKVVITANEAVALGTIAAGCKFFSSYPMTPASSILHNLANWAKESGMVVKQSEDEISAIHMALGASFAGARAMTCTSGGGFALMVEGLALSAMTETPVVIAESQRPGPATGLPTWGGQEDLRFVANTGHGDFIRIVLTPGDAKEAYFLTPWAFNLAEKYQVPVIILLDKFISEGHESVADLTDKKIIINRGKLLTREQLGKIKEYKRYELTKDGVSFRALPGMAGGVHIANSDEHDEFGFSTEGFMPEIRIRQVDKRYAKLPAILKDLPKPRFYGSKKAKTTLIGWGSVKGPVLEALKSLPEGRYNFIHFTAVNPIDAAEVGKMLKGSGKLVLIESNKTGQFGDLLKQNLNVDFERKILKYSGIPFYPEELIEELSLKKATAIKIVKSKKKVKVK
ncbi:2-oxoacid:acceptor oxidoreductase subunit alpha [Candidatus Parcubacteria bacterium]|nr:MAG: 2-oxoacid:acceptor oxidoreductase subunit alpha [Candidatus Parcubacteria bacterium]